MGWPCRYGQTSTLGIDWTSAGGNRGANKREISLAKRAGEEAIQHAEMVAAEKHNTTHPHGITIKRKAAERLSDTVLSARTFARQLPHADFPGQLRVDEGHRGGHAGVGQRIAVDSHLDQVREKSGTEKTKRGGHIIFAVEFPVVGYTAVLHVAREKLQCGKHNLHSIRSK